jgi:DNA-binding LacI/PurR family transcriptional regulator
VSKRVTIKMVAAHAGVSHQTVSRVINDKPGVAPETRARVLASIEALNYQPSLAARVLSKRHMSVIGVVIPFDPDFLFSDPHLLQVIHGIDREITLRDYSLLLSTPRSTHKPASAYHRLLKERLVDGVIVEGGMGEAGVQLLVDKGYPVVMVGYSASGIPSVHPDDEGGAYTLTQHLLALSHRRIGVIAGPDYLATKARWRGYERAFLDAGLDTDPALLIHGDFTSHSGYEGVAHLMQRPDSPSAIFAFNDRMAMGAIRWLREHGYVAPGDVSVVGFDDVPMAELFDPPLTTVRLFSADLGRRAVTLLFDLIDGNPPPTTEVVLPSRLIVRRSTTVAPAARSSLKA